MLFLLLYVLLGALNGGAGLVCTLQLFMLATQTQNIGYTEQYTTQ